ncbi:MarR family transcriptional regulator [Micromonospora sp. CPCC 205371]|nr:MarR family transcriptional regulator [Micromonospora sp. CPCC 205371]
MRREAIESALTASRLRQGDPGCSTSVEDGGDGEVTVGVVADRLAVASSVASRMVTDCITAGYVVRCGPQIPRIA